MIDLLRPYLGRIIAAFVAFLITWLNVHYNITIDTDTQAHIVGALAGIIGIALGAFSVTHRAVDSKLNPTDAAGAGVAARTKAAHDEGRL